MSDLSKKWNEEKNAVKDKYKKNTMDPHGYQIEKEYVRVCRGGSLSPPVNRNNTIKCNPSEILQDKI